MTAVPSVVAMRENVWLVDCYWECYVLVGQNARGKRQDIATVMQAAKVLYLISVFGYMLTYGFSNYRSPRPRANRSARPSTSSTYHLSCRWTFV
jgi:hypothetical protein